MAAKVERTPGQRIESKFSGGRRLLRSNLLLGQVRSPLAGFGISERGFFAVASRPSRPCNPLRRGECLIAQSFPVFDFRGVDPVLHDR